MHQIKCNFQSEVSLGIECNFNSDPLFWFEHLIHSSYQRMNIGFNCEYVNACVNMRSCSGIQERVYGYMSAQMWIYVCASVRLGRSCAPHSEVSIHTDFKWNKMQIFCSFFSKKLFVLFALDAFFLRTINCKWMHVLQLNFKIAYLSLGAIGKLFFFSSSFSFSFAKLLVILIGNFSVARFKRNWMCSLA